MDHDEQPPRQVVSPSVTAKGEPLNKAWATEPPARMAGGEGGADEDASDRDLDALGFALPLQKRSPTASVAAETPSRVRCLEDVAAVFADAFHWLSGVTARLRSPGRDGVHRAMPARVVGAEHCRAAENSAYSALRIGLDAACVLTGCVRTHGACQAHLHDSHRAFRVALRVLDLRTQRTGADPPVPPATRGHLPRAHSPGLDETLAPEHSSVKVKPRTPIPLWSRPSPLPGTDDLLSRESTVDLSHCDLLRSALGVPRWFPGITWPHGQIRR